MTFIDVSVVGKISVPSKPQILVDEISVKLVDEQSVNYPTEAAIQDTSSTESTILGYVINETNRSYKNCTSSGFR